jgi:CheY-like chemotaxis protein
MSQFRFPGLNPADSPRIAPFKAPTQSAETLPVAHLVLTVDDSRLMRSMIRKILESDGYEVKEATGGEEALKTALEQPFSCVVLDLLMPVMDGREILKRLRAQGYAGPVVFVTANIQEHVKAECMELGAYAVVHKPPQIETVLSVVRAAIAAQAIA